MAVCTYFAVHDVFGSRPNLCIEDFNYLTLLLLIIVLISCQRNITHV